MRNDCIKFVSTNSNLNSKEFAKAVIDAGIIKSIHPAYFKLYRSGEFDFETFFSKNYKLFILPEAS